MNPLKEIIERRLKISTICMTVVIIALPATFVWAYLSYEKNTLKWFLLVWLILFVSALIMRYLLIKCPSCGESLQNIADFYKPSLFTLSDKIKCCPYCRASLDSSTSSMSDTAVTDFQRKNRFEKITLLCMFFAIIIASLSALYLNLQQKHGIDKVNYSAIMALIEKGKYNEAVKCLKVYGENLQAGESPLEALKTLSRNLKQELKNTVDRQ